MVTNTNNEMASDWLDEDGENYRTDSELINGGYYIGNNLFVNETNKKFVLLDSCRKVLLQATYQRIQIYHHLDYRICVIETSSGKILYNVETGDSSKEYEDLVVVEKTFNTQEDQVYFKSHGKYGVLNLMGNEILPAKYELLDSNKLVYIYKGRKIEIYIKRGLLYGKIPKDKYDNCFRLGRGIFGYIYITERGTKYGFVSDMTTQEVEPIFDDIILYKENDLLSDGCTGNIALLSISHSVIFIIARKKDKYWLYNADEGTCILEKCEYIKYHEESKGYYTLHNHPPYIEFQKGNIQGYVLSGGVVISNKEYDSIKIDRNERVYVEKNGKHGLLDIYGMFLIPCEYDSINYCDGYYTAIKNGTETIVPFSNPRKKTYLREPQRYSRYGGTYAQDVEGYSDDDIDTIFEGDPLAYWNID